MQKKVIIEGKISSSQDGVVVNPDGLAPCHTAGHDTDVPKILIRHGPKITF